MVLDLVDKGILLELKGYCRLPYATLARHFGLTVNAVKKRVKKLIEMGVIVDFVAVLNRGLVGGGLKEKVFAWVWTDGSEDEEVFIQRLGAFPSVYSVWKTTRKTYGVYSPVSGFSAVSKLVRFLQKIVPVTRVEIDGLVPLDSPGARTVLSSQRWCYEFNFTKSDLLVLRCLKEDPRMPIQTIAGRTRLTPKRVRKILKTFEETRCVVLYALVDDSKGGLVAALIRTRLDPTAISDQEFTSWLFDQYPFECWDAFSVVNEPGTVLQYVTAHTLNKIDEMATTIRKAPFTKEVDPIVEYGDRLFPRKLADHIEKLLTNAGL